MPIGFRRVVPSSGPAIVPPFYLAPGTVDQAPQRDTWHHEFIANTKFTIPNGLVYTFACPVATRFKLLLTEARTYLVRFNRPFKGDAGDLQDFDLLHPGSGELDESVPAFTLVSLEPIGAPNASVNAYCLGGTYADRPN